MAIRINLKDPDLFGALAAEDEDEAVFTSYQMERAELHRLTSANAQNNLVVISAFRGEGKSALLRIAYKALRARQTIFLNKTTAVALTVDKSSPDVNLLTRLWKSSIYNHVA